jgi:hypothetical protein
MIEQLAQEALKARKEIRASETKKAQRRGFLLIQGAQTIIDQLKNDLDLIEITRILVDDPVKSRGELSGLEPMQLEEITRSENPEVPPPQIRSLGEISTHLLAANSHFFYDPISCLHLCLANIKFSSQFSNKRHFHFLRHLHTYFRFVFTTVSVKT